MSSHAFKKLDAFASGTSGGNPAGAVFLEALEALTEGEMQRIARELKGFVSEVGFVARLGPDAFRLRYFSSEKEVQFCGHATIAIAHDLVSHDAGLAALPRFWLHTNKGVLSVENAEGAVFIQAPEPVFTPCDIPLQEVCAALSLAEERVDRALAIGLVNAGNQTLCVPLRSLGDVVALAPDFAALKAFCHRHGLDVVTVFTESVADPANRLRTRVFAAPFGYLEDPATGSGNAALAYHLHRLGRWDGSAFCIEQGADPANPNRVRIRSAIDSGGGFRVSFGGAAILRIEGRYWL